jgi:hypothetical protein
MAKDVMQQVDDFLAGTGGKLSPKFEAMRLRMLAYVDELDAKAKAKKSRRRKRRKKR